MSPDKARALESCPFCGGEAELDTQRAYSAMPYDGRVHNEVAIYCTKCGADMACDPKEVHGEIDDVVNELVAAWNYRAIQASAVAEREAVTETCRQRAIVLFQSFVRGAWPDDEEAFIEAVDLFNSALTEALRTDHLPSAGGEG